MKFHKVRSEPLLLLRRQLFQTTLHDSEVADGRAKSGHSFPVGIAITYVLVTPFDHLFEQKIEFLGVGKGEGDAYCNMGTQHANVYGPALSKTRLKTSDNGQARDFPLSKR